MEIITKAQNKTLKLRDLSAYFAFIENLWEEIDK